MNVKSEIAVVQRFVDERLIASPGAPDIAHMSPPSPDTMHQAYIAWREGAGAPRLTGIMLAHRLKRCTIATTAGGRVPLARLAVNDRWLRWTDVAYIEPPRSQAAAPSAPESHEAPQVSHEAIRRLSAGDYDPKDRDVRREAWATHHGFVLVRNRAVTGEPCLVCAVTSQRYSPHRSHDSWSRGYCGHVHVGLEPFGRAPDHAFMVRQGDVFVFVSEPYCGRPYGDRAERDGLHSVSLGRSSTHNADTFMHLTAVDPGVLDRFLSRTPPEGAFIEDVALSLAGACAPLLRT